MDVAFPLVATLSPTRGLPVRLAPLGDERLARLVGRGSDRAFATLYGRYHQPVYRHCRALLRNEADAQDALQSTFAAALVALRCGRRDAPLRPWLFRIAQNESMSVLRLRRRDRDPLAPLVDSAASAADAADGRARLALLLADLRDLPERQRGALVMHELSGLTHEEVALALGISPGAARQALYEARCSLTEFAEGRAMACEDVRRAVSDGDKRSLRGRRVRGHLRECAGCAEFAAAIPARRDDLLALCPALPALTAASVFGRIARAGSARGGHGGVFAGGSGKLVGATLSAKAVVAEVAIVATATVAAAGALHRETASGRLAVRSAAAGASRVAVSRSTPGHRSADSGARVMPGRRTVVGPGAARASMLAAGRALGVSPRRGVASLWLGGARQGSPTAPAASPGAPRPGPSAVPPTQPAPAPIGTPPGGSSVGVDHASGAMPGSPGATHGAAPSSAGGGRPATLPSPEATGAPATSSATSGRDPSPSAAGVMPPSSVQPGGQHRRPT